MPLFDITCNRRLYPPDKVYSALSGINDPDLSLEHQQFIFFKNALPGVIIRDMGEFLERGTTEVDVQVKLHRFHDQDVNVPDIGIELVLTEEPPPTKIGRMVIRACFMDVISALLRQHGLRVAWSLDLFWGPGHGCQVSASGSVIKEW